MLVVPDQMPKIRTHPLRNNAPQLKTHHSKHPTGSDPRPSLHPETVLTGQQDIPVDNAADIPGWGTGNADRVAE